MSNSRRFGRDISNGALGGIRLPEPTRVAVVGLGYWGPNLLRVLFELPDVEVKYVCDLDDDRPADRRSAFAQPLISVHFWVQTE